MANSKTQIIIPMSGYGERFRVAGYSKPKPLIKVEGKPIIQHVVEMFPGETNFLFICNEEHLNHPEFELKETLKSICPTGKVFAIKPHKLGPVHAVLQATKLIDHNLPTIVNYCDFTCYWDWGHFKKWTIEQKVDGCVPAYKGFHPHSLGKTNYAYMQENNGNLLAIKEKEPFTDNRLNEYASSGTYYFSSGKVMLDSLEQMVVKDKNVNGEYYVSLAYNELLAEKKTVSVYPIQHFMQWGTPEDLEEYVQWSEAFRALGKRKKDRNEAFSAIVTPMAGKGQRFVDQQYSKPKPLINVSGMPMAVQAIKSYLPTKITSVVVRAEMEESEELKDVLGKNINNLRIAEVETVTSGQATTAKIGLEVIVKKEWENLECITFTACDSGVLFDFDKLKSIIMDDDVDIVVWGKRGHSEAIRNPKMFGWIDADASGNIKNVIVKNHPFNPMSDPMVVGTFSFKKREHFLASYERMTSRKGLVNGEYYLDECINDALSLNLKCRLFEVDHILPWGTPNELRTFNYWQSCFHKWDGHPYRVENDSFVDEKQFAELVRSFNDFFT